MARGSKRLLWLDAAARVIEGNPYAAGMWKRANAPQKLLQCVGRYHAWERA